MEVVYKGMIFFVFVSHRFKPVPKRGTLRVWIMSKEDVVDELERTQI